MSKDSERTNKKKNPYLPKDGSEDPRPLLIPLQNYKLRHDTFQETEKKDNPEKDNDFIGRKNLLKQLGELLENTNDTRGSYLVAGYRGSGKTSLINRVLIKYKNYKEKSESRASNKTNWVNCIQKLFKKKEVIIVRINLGHDEVLDTRHVLFNIISSLRHEFKLYNRLIRKNILIVIFFFIFLFSFCWFLYSYSIGKEQNLTNVNFCHNVIEYAPTLTNFFQNLDKICNFFNLKLKNLKIENFPVWFFSFLILMLFLFSLRMSRGWLLDCFLFIKCKRKNSVFFLVRKIQKLHDKVAYSFEMERGALNIRSGLGFRTQPLCTESA